MNPIPAIPEIRLFVEVSGSEDEDEHLRGVSFGRCQFLYKMFWSGLGWFGERFKRTGAKKREDEGDSVVTVKVAIENWKILWLLSSSLIGQFCYEMGLGFI